MSYLLAKLNMCIYIHIFSFTNEMINYLILFSDSTKEEACNKEIQLIAEYQATDRTKGYNHSSGGENPLVCYRGEKHPMYGKHHSLEARARMSASHTGEKHRCWGTHLPEITRKRIGDANRERRLPEWQIEHLRKINTGRDILNIHFTMEKVT